MALTVAPAPGWDSYASQAAADAYFAELGYAPWAAATSGSKDNALRLGTAYINTKRPLPGYISPVVHPNIERATFEAAKLVLAGTLYRAGGSSSQAVIEKSVGPLTIRYANPTDAAATATTFPVIDDLLFGLTYGMGTPVFFERV